jgi:hypothetical protein
MYGFDDMFEPEEDYRGYEINRDNAGSIVFANVPISRGEEILEAWLDSRMDAIADLGAAIAPGDPMVDAASAVQERYRKTRWMLDRRGTACGRLFGRTWRNGGVEWAEAITQSLSNQKECGEHDPYTMLCEIAETASKVTDVLGTMLAIEAVRFMQIEAAHALYEIPKTVRTLSRLVPGEDPNMEVVEDRRRWMREDWLPFHVRRYRMPVEATRAIMLWRIADMRRDAALMGIEHAPVKLPKGCSGPLRRFEEARDDARATIDSHMRVRRDERPDALARLRSMTNHADERWPSSPEMHVAEALRTSIQSDLPADERAGAEGRRQG